MSTFLFDKTIFGPVNSRRLGISLGINLLPNNTKVCSFDCIYCECGWTPNNHKEKIKLPQRNEVKRLLEAKLMKMKDESKLPDVITFAGNGEPTMHPQFAGIINDTIILKNKITPYTRIAVLSNASMLHKKPVFEALLKIKDNIQKLDSAVEETVQLMDCPKGNFKLEQIIKQLTAFNGKVTIQTMFVRGIFKDKKVDNTTTKEILAWIETLKKIKPKQVMIYTIARDTPLNTLQKIPLEELNNIAQKVEAAGINVQVSG